MALDRQSIEKKDFPVGRRGYDPEAVDGHLAALADEVDELRASSSRPGPSLATAASDQVRTIVEAAEASADEIRRGAEQEAEEVRAAADDETRSARERASGEAREYVERVSAAATTLLGRVEAMETELGGLVEQLRTGANRLSLDLQALQDGLAEVREVTGTAEDEGVAEEAAVPAYAGDESGNGAAAEEPEPEPEAAGDDEAESARLVALNMALNGSSRDETDRYLTEHFSLEDQTELLDEVYATVEH